VTVDLARDRPRYEIYVELIRAGSPRLAACASSFPTPVVAGSGSPWRRVPVARSWTPTRGDRRPRVTFDVVVSAEQIARKKPDRRRSCTRSSGLRFQPPGASSWKTPKRRARGTRAGCACSGSRRRSRRPCCAQGAFAVAADFRAVPGEVRSALGSRSAVTRETGYAAAITVAAIRPRQRRFPASGRSRRTCAPRRSARAGSGGR